MRILVHDYGAFSFPVQLSRELARRDYEVLHLYSDFEPHGGMLARQPGDPASFRSQAISIGEPFDKYSFSRRFVQETKYGRELNRNLVAAAPDVVLSANAPVSVSHMLSRRARTIGSSYIHWTQDIHTLAMRQVLPHKLGRLGSAVSRVFEWSERRTIEKSDEVIVIADEFRQAMSELGWRPARVHTIPNWMPLLEIPEQARQNRWAQRRGLAETTNILYSGTMSFKHDEGIFVRLAQAFSRNDSVRVVVVGAGVNWERLVQAKESLGLDNLVLFGWQPYEDVPSVLASGDILVSVLARDASEYSVPSKVLSYFCAGRSVLVAIPSKNRVRRIVEENDLGLASDPDDVEGIISQARQLVASPETRSRMAANSRQFAERNFDISRISDRFESIILAAVGEAPPFETRF